MSLSDSSRAPQLERLNAAFVHAWAKRHWMDYDKEHYEPFIVDARKGDPSALRKVTEWKNIGNGASPQPIPFQNHPNKEKSFQSFLKGLPDYLRDGGSSKLRRKFCRTSPVWAIFWHHVLFGSPIFDIHTNRAFQFFNRGVLLKGRAPSLSPRGHWDLYDDYCAWFHAELIRLKEEDQTITERQLDRALMQWGIAHK